MIAASLATGSSPLTRGKHHTPRPDSRAVGLIPTHAGKTAATPRPAPVCRAHPHSRGENQACAITCTPMPGSSPLTRGKRPTQTKTNHGSRLIPTHAGKTPAHSTRLSRSWAHPHSRGENQALSHTTQTHLGSSPLTRGKRYSLSDRPRRPGLIPTHAGKTRSRRGDPGYNRAHPHSRGENRPCPSTAVLPAGSSPLTRGKQSAGREVTREGGLIPTHAGKTPGTQPSRCRARAHPHSRGENAGP